LSGIGVKMIAIRLDLRRFLATAQRHDLEQIAVQ
jgi:hypothetical protein